ncbi:DUF862 domain-containing protein [Citrus sinensis]|uniref:DUF862 domain-containing protein n=1 Tax=Citrus sinensis TaxID=2711 RepID=A0ACB8MV15_CITSI|nr:DUF862 domain-containing protein [Citrus sinensis]KAH9789674.1 DUF862 domain-containing protein [Citrus sinensis]
MQQVIENMDKSAYASIDMEKLADSLSGKLKTLRYPSSEARCIYRVPQTRRCFHPIDYTPQLVSIGPLHHGNPELQAMEEHKLRYLHHFLQRTKPPHSPAQSEFPYRNIPGAKELDRAGVKFKSGPNKNLLDIKFDKGTLEIPIFSLFDSTERFYRNLLVFETMHDYPTKYFNDYVITMTYFLVTPKDADLLIQNEIIGLGDSEKLSTVFHSLSKDCVKGGHDFQYVDVARALQAYCKSPWQSWKTNLKQNYFNTPWASISVIAAVILLLLTVTQTICSIIAL